MMIKMNVGSLIASVFSVFLLIPCHSGILILTYRSLAYSYEYTKCVT